jgi:hypothetical protein
VQGRKKPNPKKSGQGQSKNPSTNNSFEILNQLLDSQEVENPHHHENQGNTKGKDKADSRS